MKNKTERANKKAYWIVTNRKSAHRKGKVQLISAVDFYETMTPHSLGNKRRYITPHHKKRIVELYQAMEENEHCRIFESAPCGSISMPRQNALNG